MKGGCFRLGSVARRVDEPVQIPRHFRGSRRCVWNPECKSERGRVEFGEKHCIPMLFPSCGPGGVLSRVWLSVVHHAGPGTKF